MWEFSIMLQSCHSNIAKFLYNGIKKNVEEVDGVITSFEQNDTIHIVVACREEEKTRLFFYVKSFITEAICSFFKTTFLKNNLKINLKNKISIVAFERALEYFDRETDRYLVEKNLVFNKNINLESFFEFKLKVLKNKWLELTKIANENSSYLLTDDTFYELLKFLIENIEISYDTINIILNTDGYTMLDENFKCIENFKECGDGVWLIENIIALSPRKINVYSDSETDEICLINNIFANRTNILPKESVKIVDKIF